MTHIFHSLGRHYEHANCVNKSCFSNEAPSRTVLYYDLPFTLSDEVADTTNCIQHITDTQKFHTYTTGKCTQHSDIHTLTTTEGH